MRIFIRLTSMLFVFGCGTRTDLSGSGTVLADASTVDAIGPDASVDAAGDGAPITAVCSTPGVRPPADACVAQLQVGLIVPSSPNCFVDTLVHEGEVGTLRYACQGPANGAVADFARGEFGGTINSDAERSLSLCSGTTFPWTDGCTWSSAQRITGDFASGTLTFTYEEQPIQGNHCQQACSATGTVLVH